MGVKGIMKEVKWLMGMGIIASVMIMAIGCGGGDTAEKKLSDTENINQLISGQYADVFGNDIRVDKPVEDQESVGERLSKQAAIPVPSWRRTIERPISRNISITQTGDTAEVTVISTINGTLDINTNADTNIDETKIIKDTAGRSAIFKRNASGKWALAEVSPIEYSLSSTEAPVTQTIQIAGVEISKFDGTTSTWSTVWPPETKRPLSDPATKLIFPDEIPTFNPNDRIKVEVTITNADSSGERDSYCYLHHDSQRDFMYDDGVNEGDEGADDNIFTAEYNIGSGTGYRHAAMDCIDGATLQDYTQDNYNAEAWGLPYKVE